MLNDYDRYRRIRQKSRQLLPMSVQTRADLGNFTRYDQSSAIRVLPKTSDLPL